MEENVFSNKFKKAALIFGILIPILVFVPAFLLRSETAACLGPLLANYRFGLFSGQFILFLLAVGAVYFYLGHKKSEKQWCVLLAASYFFYACGGIALLIPLLITTTATWAGALLIEKTADHYKAMLKGQDSDTKKEIRAKSQFRRRILAALIVILNLGILAVFKYTNFILENVSPLLSRDFSAINFLVPLGLSYYTFQSTGYLIDIYRGKYRADRNLVKFALFVSYFPQITMGPIGRHDLLAHRLYENHLFEYDRAKFGIQRMLWGYFKKIVIADRINLLSGTVFGAFAAGAAAPPSYSGFTVFVSVLFYGIQIYCDFSGGMDIVIGASQIFGIEMSENFRRPYFARSVSEYWQRWHITLGAWMRDYLFYPLALSKPFNNLSKSLRTHINPYVAKILPTSLASLIVFFLIGLWHGANWKYVWYGIYQAFFVSGATLFEPLYAKSRAFFRVKSESSGYKTFQTLRTVAVITVGRYFSRSDTAGQAFAMLKATFTDFNPHVFADGTFYQLGLDRDDFYLMILCVLFLFFIDFVQESGNEDGYVRKKIAGFRLPARWAIYLCGIFAILIFGVYGPGYNAANFIYAGF